MGFSKEFENILNSIIKEIRKFEKERDDYHSQILSSFHNDVEIDPAFDEYLDFSFVNTKIFVKDKFPKLRKLSIKENYYFFDCPFEVYKNFYEKRKMEFIENNIDVDEVDFIKRELANCDNKKNERVLEYGSRSVKYHDFIDETYNLKKTEQKKIQFLQNKLEQLERSSKKESIKIKSATTQNQYLEAFCKSISNERELNDTSFMQLYDYVITHFTSYLKNEISENLLSIDDHKARIYLNYVRKKISETPYFQIKDNIIDKWLKEYDVDIVNFPNFENKELDKILRAFHGGYHLTEQDSEKIWNIQIEFYVYSCMIEAKKIITFIDSLILDENPKANQKNKDNKQLTINQIVLLLDKLGLFNDGFLETLPNTKKAYIVSITTGLNQKNIKSAIERLEKKPSELSEIHRKDIKKIESIFKDLD